MNSCHVVLIDTQIRKALRIISGVVKSTPVEWFVLSNIIPALISRQEFALGEYTKISEDNELPIYGNIPTAPVNKRLISRKPCWNFFREGK